MKVKLLLNMLVIAVVVKTQGQEKKVKLEDNSNATNLTYENGSIKIQGSSGEQSKGQVHIIGNGESGPGDAYISFSEGGEANSKWSLGVKDNDNAFSISYGLTMDAAPKFLIRESSGNVGIGTTDPTGKLHIQGAGGEQQQGQVHITGNGGPGPGDAYISFSEGVEENSKWSLGVKDNGNAFSISHGLTMDASPKFIIKEGNGNVGIGTVDPDAKLAVNGKIHTKEVKVDLNVPGPDYVFEEDYDLRTLKETKAYIQTHKHLPEIPSAKEMEANGVDLGDMNMKLLKKIEELTLYLIEQEKRIEKLEEVNKSLQK